MEIMLSTFIKISSFIIVFLSFVLLCNEARLYTSHINYTDTSMYNKIKGELEGYGYTVTGTNSNFSGTLSDFSDDLHINVAGNNNCLKIVRLSYETYIGNGGTVLIWNGDRDGNRTLLAL